MDFGPVVSIILFWTYIVPTNLISKSMYLDSIKKQGSYLGFSLTAGRLGGVLCIGSLYRAGS